MEKAKSVAIPLTVNAKFSIDDGKSKVDASNYRNIIGSLLYLSVTRPDIMHAASLLSRFMHSPSKAHLCAAKRALRYIRALLIMVFYSQEGKVMIMLVFPDSDWAGSVDDSKSTSSYFFLLAVIFLLEF